MSVHLVVAGIRSLAHMPCAVMLPLSCLIWEFPQIGGGKAPSSGSLHAGSHFGSILGAPYCWKRPYDIAGGPFLRYWQEPLLNTFRVARCTLLARLLIA